MRSDGGTDQPRPINLLLRNNKGPPKRAPVLLTDGPVYAAVFLRMRGGVIGPLFARCFVPRI